MDVFAPTASKELITGGDNKVLYDTTNTAIPVESWDWHGAIDKLWLELSA
jgi:hypothetical protein